MQFKISRIGYLLTLISLFACTGKQNTAEINFKNLERLRISNNDSFELVSDNYLTISPISILDSSSIFMEKGHYYYNNEVWDSAVKYFRSAYNLRQITGDSELVYNSLISLNKSLPNRSNKYRVLIETIKKARKFRRDSISIIDDCIDLANNYDIIGETDSAFEYIQNGLYLAKLSRDSSRICKALMNYSLYCQSAGLYDSSEYYLNLISTKTDYSKTIKNKLRLLMAFGSNFYSMGKYTEAIKYYKSALNISRQFRINTEEKNSTFNMALAFEQQKNYDSSIKYLIECIDITETSLSDSLRNSIASYEVKFRTKQKVKEAALLHYKNKQKNYLMIVLVLTILLISTIYTLYYRNTRQKLRIQSSEIDDLLQKQELSIIDATLTGQDRERQRIAQELHDSIGSNLAWAKMHFSTIEDEMERMKASNREKYAEMNRILEETLTDVRRISHDLYGSTVLKLGLKVAATQLVEAIQKSYAIKINLFTKNLPESGYDTEINVYRIFQELLSNSLKHAGAQRIDIQLIGEEKNLHLAYEDDGKGMDLSAGRTGMGLTSVESRVQHLKGKTHLESRPGQGFTFFADIPLV